MILLRCVRFPTFRHQPPQPSAERAPSAFPSEILPDFLYLGTYDHSARAETLKAIGIKDILNCVGPSCQNLHKNSFNYHTVGSSSTSEAATTAAAAVHGGDDGGIPSGNNNKPKPREVPFQECLEFLEQAREGGRKVLVFCMTGTSRSPSVIIAYLMRLRRWRLTQSYRWVKERHDVVNLQPVAAAQLSRNEFEVFGEEANVPLKEMPDQSGMTPLPEISPFGNVSMACGAGDLSAGGFGGGLFTFGACAAAGRGAGGPGFGGGGVGGAAGSLFGGGGGGGRGGGGVSFAVPGTMGSGGSSGFNFCQPIGGGNNAQPFVFGAGGGGDRGGNGTGGSPSGNTGIWEEEEGTWFWFLFFCFFCFFSTKTRGNRDERNDACRVTAFLFSEGKGMDRGRVS